jgi:hypothetical protein
MGKDYADSGRDEQQKYRVENELPVNRYEPKRRCRRPKSRRARRKSTRRKSGQSASQK